MSRDHDPLTQGEILSALGVTELDLPDHATHPLCATVVSFAIDGHLRDTLGAERVFNAALLAGNYGDPTFDEWMQQGRNAYDRWRKSRERDGKPHGMKLLKAAAKKELANA